MAKPDLIIPYDPGFLGDGFNVHLPRLTDALRMSAFANGNVLDYTHFSLVMHEHRRIAIYAAANIDASHMVKVSKAPTWHMDERVGEHQLGPEAYDGQPVKSRPTKSPLVKREHVLWGSVAEAKHADVATHFYTNAAPQHQHFNQDEWDNLEDWLLNDATEFSYRLCVFTGPVLRSNDAMLSDRSPKPRGGRSASSQARIPSTFWKVIVLRDGTAGGDDLSAVGFAMRQTDTWNDKQGKALLKLKVHQVTIEAIESWTGLDFGSLRRVDELAGSAEQSRKQSREREAKWPVIGSASDIVYGRARRRARGMRATATPDARSAAGRAAGPSPVSVGGRATHPCGCHGSEEFDPRAAIAALSRDVTRLTDLIAAQSRQARPAETLAGRTRSLMAADPMERAAAPGDDPRIEQIVAQAPASQKEAVRTFARTIVAQGDVARGSVAAAHPTELERIVGGDTVPPNRILSCVCIGGPTDWFCTGVVVAPHAVLTAAHCGNSITRIMAGGNQVVPAPDQSARIVPVRQVFVHPDYRSTTHENDINLVILAQAVSVPPAAIATLDQLRAANQVLLAGFGYNDPNRPLNFGIKRQVKVPLGPIKLSDDDDWSGLERQFGFHSAYEFVAGRKGLGRDTCNGDSGGPAYVETGAGLIVAGITSRASSEATVNCGDGGNYVRPDRFLDWINETLTSAGLGPLQ
jgi:endonuclease G